MNKTLHTLFYRVCILLSSAVLLSVMPAGAQVSITCPGDITVGNDAGQCAAIVNYTPPVGTGSGTGITTTLTAGLPSGASFNVGTTAVTYTVTNNEGDSDDCTFFVTVNDIEVPEFDCPGDIEVDADPVTCEAIVNFDIPTASDNCGVFSIFQFGGPPSGSAFPIGTTFLDFQAVDINGNNGFCRVRVIVNDSGDPQISCPGNMIVELYENCDSVLNYTPPVGTDNCSSANTVLTSGNGSGSSFSVGTTTETYTVSDQYGNTASCSFDITILDAAPPEITCPGDITVNADPGDCEAIVTFADATATDNCTVASISQTAGLSSGDAFPTGVNTVEFMALDQAGNESVCSFTVAVIENVSPTITCPGNISVSNDPGQCGAIVNYTAPIGTDNCPGAITQLTSGIGSGNLFPVGVTTETYTVTDASGNTAVCSFDVEVLDTEAPVIDCPANVIASNDPGLCEAVVTFTAPAATDNCAMASIIQTDGPVSGSTFPLGSTPVEYTATDAAGNTSTCTFNIVVEDTEAPSITCPGDISLTVPGDACSMAISYPLPTVSDNCPGTTINLVSGPASGDVVSAGIYTIELEAEDAAGNTSPCSFTLTVAETSDPVFTCPDDLVVSAAAGTCEAIVNFSIPTATDSCSAVSVAQTGGPVPGSTFTAGATAVEFTATDAFGNTAVCEFDVIVDDGVDPEIICPGDIVVDADPGTCETVVNFATPVATDNCALASVTQIGGPLSGSVFPAGETTITFEAIDVSGNASECSFTVTVEDSENPVITCPIDLVKNIPDGGCSTPILFAPPTATDNCGIDDIIQIEGLASGDDFPLGINTLVFVASDLSGNTDTCSFTIEVTESVPPEIVCPADTTISTEPGLCEAEFVYTPPVGTDNCGNVTTQFISGMGSGANFPVGVTTETYTVTDFSGNTATCSFTVTVVDDELPVFECPGDTSIFADDGLCSAVFTFSDPAVVDNCDSGVLPILTSPLSSGDAFPVGNNTIEYSATDAAGNIATCSYTVTVLDTVPPEINCPGDIVANAADGDCGTIVTYPDPVVSDNCAGATLTLLQGYASGSVFPVGETTLQFEAEDASGNTDTCSFKITVNEGVDPTITCQNDTTVSNDAGTCGAIVDYAVPVGMDDCSIDTTVLIAGLDPGSLFPVGTTTISYQVTDISGNQASCSFDITVNDTEDPIFECPENETLQIDDGLCGTEFTFDIPDVSDNCTDNLVVSQSAGPASGDILPLGETNFEFTGTDDAGNTATCGFSITVVDTVSPTFTLCPMDTVIALDANSCEAFVSFDQPLAFDNCDFILEQISGPPNNSNQPPGEYAFEYTVTDESGNSSSCSFTVTVVDTIAPTLECIDDFETCSNTPEFEIPEATDNCSIAEVVQTEGPPSGSTFPEGTTTLVFTASDVNGNTTECVLNITVLENAPRVDLGDDMNICSDTTVTLQGANPGSAVPLWTLISGGGAISDPDSPETEADVTTGENIFVYSLDPGNGCEITSDTIMVYVEPGVEVEAGDDRIIFKGGNADLSAAATPPGGDYLWLPQEGLSCVSCANPVAAPDETTQYTVSYTSPLGCEVNDSLIVRVTVKLPNTITPDGDGVNDVWNIPGIDEYPEVVVIIYNRWGNEVFSSTGYNQAWDGMHNGKGLPTGSYFYLIDYKMDGKENLNGTVNIIR